MCKAIDVYLEKRKTRQYVGRLSYIKKKFIFKYDDLYRLEKKSIPLGPEFPISKRIHTSLELFPSFKDRIPSRKNPAYAEYCQNMRISPNETDPMILLSSIGKKTGVSSFVFDPVFDDQFSNENLKKFRKNLKLSIREFAEIFDISPSSIYCIENNKISGKDILKRISLYIQFPSIALRQIQLTGSKINNQKKIFAEQVLNEKNLNQLHKFLETLNEVEFRVENNIRIKIIQQIDNKQLIETEKVKYEKIAFSFLEGSSANLKEWEDFNYRPSFSAKDRDGNIFCDPDIKNISPSMINYWEKRAHETKNPILQFRYAGLVWDFSKKIRKTEPDISLAYMIIDSIYKISYMDQKKSHLQYQIEKGLRLAVSIEDKKRITIMRDALIDYEKCNSKDSETGTWGYSFDLLIGDKKLCKKIPIKEGQKDFIIEELERRLGIFSNTQSDMFNSHVVEAIVPRLAFYYKREVKNNDLKRVLIKYKDVFLHFSKNHYSKMAGHIILEKVRKLLFQYNYIEEAQSLEHQIREFEEKSLKELKKYELSFLYPQEEINNYKKELDNLTIDQSLTKVSLDFIPKKDIAEKILNKEKYSLQSPIPIEQMDYKGRVVNKIDTVEEDFENKVALQFVQCTQFYLAFLEEILDYLVKEKSLNEEILFNYLFKSSLFSKNHQKIIKEGLKAFFNKNYIVSSSILCPQIEAVIRELISKKGGEIYQNHQQDNKRFMLKPLSSLIGDEKFKEVFNKIDKNISYYFQVLLTDRRGWNLRNIIAHGDVPSSFFNKEVAISVIHILLILSLYLGK